MRKVYCVLKESANGRSALLAFLELFKSLEMIYSQSCFILYYVGVYSPNAHYRMEPNFRSPGIDNLTQSFDSSHIPPSSLCREDSLYPNT